MGQPRPISPQQMYPPLCGHCGGRTVLARVDPAPDRDHDLRTFKCMACGRSEIVRLKLGSA